MAKANRQIQETDEQCRVVVDSGLKYRTLWEAVEDKWGMVLSILGGALTLILYFTAEANRVTKNEIVRDLRDSCRNVIQEQKRYFDSVQNANLQPKINIVVDQSKIAAGFKVVNNEQ